MAQGFAAAVPRSPAVPIEKQDMPQRAAAEVAAAAWVAWEERAAIREFEGGMSRREAEAATAQELGPAPARPPSGTL